MVITFFFCQEFFSLLPQNQYRISRGVIEELFHIIKITLKRKKMKESFALNFFTKLYEHVLFISQVNLSRELIGQ